MLDSSAAATAIHAKYRASGNLLGFLTEAQQAGLTLADLSAEVTARGPLPKPTLPACAAAKPSEVGFTRWQIRAAEKLVLAEVSKTLAQERTASMVETRTRALITAGAVLAGFEWINSVAARGDLCRRACDEAGGVPGPGLPSVPSGQSQ